MNSHENPDNSDNALALLRRCYLHGAMVQPDGGGIRLSGRPVPDDVLAELKASKPAVLDNLREHRIGESDPGFNSPVPRRYVVPDACLATKACARLGPCSESLRRLPCDHSTPQEATS